MTLTGWKIDDDARLRALRETGLLDTPAEPPFDAIVAAAAELCAVPVALVTLLDEKRQWFTARVGVEMEGTPVGDAICVHTLEAGGTLVIPDLAVDPRTAENPLVTDDPKIRFYAGAPIVHDGQALGTVCVIDLEPRPEGLSETQLQGLERLARRTAELIDAR